jgi:hypothetical protein
VRVLLGPPRQRVKCGPPALTLALVHTAAVQRAAAPIAVWEATGAAVACETRVLLLLCADTAVSALALLTPAGIVLTAALVMATARASAVPLVLQALDHELIEAVAADEPALVLVARECEPLTVEAGLGRGSEVVPERALDEHESLVALIAVGRQLIAELADEALIGLHHLVPPRHRTAQLTVRPLKARRCHLLLIAVDDLSLLQEHPCSL